MGRGDNRTKKGKIFTGSFGVSRPAKVRKATEAKPATSSATKAQA